MADNGILETANCWIEEIKKNLEELRWQKYMSVLPNKFEVPIGNNDAPREVLLYFAYLIYDTYDYGYLGYTPREMAQMLRDISVAILDSTE